MRITPLERARVVSTGKNVARVMLDRESFLRIGEIKRTSGKRQMVVPGDVVWVHAMQTDRAIIDHAEPRTQTLTRRNAYRSKTIAANVDTMATVSALANPPPRLVLLDQLLAFAELESLEPLVLFTKPDLAEPGRKRALVQLYEGLGYRVLVLNPKTGTNVEVLRAALARRHALLCGASGVGKSSLFRSLGGEALVGEVSRRGLGRQTTSAAHLYRVEDGFLIDSPGVAEFGLGEISPAELLAGFPEMEEPAGRCRFKDCTHLHEPDCAVRAAVRSGAIAGSRYDSFRHILRPPKGGGARAGA